MTANHQDVLNGLRGVQAGLEQTSTAARSHGDRVNGVFSTIGAGAVAMGSLIASGVTMGIGSLVSGVQGAVGTGMAFQGVMNRIGAVSGATGEELDRLSAKAMQLGKDLPISAKDAADGMYALATAGFSVNDTLTISTSVAQLASSQMMEVGRASEIVAAALRGFKIPAEGSTQAIDIMSAAVMASALEMEDLGESIKYIGPIAGAAGQSISDMSVALGLMANVGLKGSMAGTALRSTLTRLVAPPKEAAIWIEKLGIQVSDSSVQIARSMKDIESDLKDWSKTATKAMQESDIAAAFDAIGAAAPRAKNGTVDVANSMKLLKGLLDNAEVSIDVKNAAMAELGITYSKAGGKMLPFLDIVDQFREKFSGLSEAERQVAAKSIAGMEAMSGFLALVDASDADYQRMRQSIEAAQGAQDRFAEAMQKGLGFQMQQLKGSIETLLIQGFLLVEPALSSMAAGGVAAVNQLIEGMTRLTDAAKIWKIAFAAGVNAGGGTGGGVASMMTSMGFDPNIAVQVGSWVTVAEGAIADAKQRLQTAATAFSIVQSAGGSTGTGINAILLALGFDPNIATTAGTVIDGIISSLQGPMERLRTGIVGLWQGMGAGESLGQLDARVLTALGLDPEIATRIGAGIDTAITAISGAVNTAKQRLQTAIGTFQLLQGQGATNGTIASGVLIALGLNEDVAGKVRVAIDTIERGLADAKTRLGNAIAGFKSGSGAGVGVQTINILTALGLSEDAAVKAGQIVANIASAISSGSERIKGAIASLMSGQGAGGMLVALGMSPETLASIQGFVSTVTGIAGRLFEQFKAGWQGMMQNLAPVMPQLQDLGAAVGRLGSVVMEILTPVAKLVGGVLVAAFIGLVGYVSGALPGVGMVISGVVQVITGAIELVTGILSGMVAITKALILGDWVGAWQSAQNAASDLWLGIINIISGAIRTVLGVVEGFIGGVIGFFTSLYNTLVGHSIIPDMVNEIIRWFTELPGRAGEAIRSGIETIVSAAQELGTSLVEKVKSFASDIYDAGTALIDTFVDGFKSKFDGAVQSVSEFIGRIRAYLPGSDAETGPLSDLTASGKALFETLAQGMELGQPAVIKRIQDAAGVIRNNLQALIDLAGAMGSAIGVTNQFGRSLGNEKEALSDLSSASSSIATFVKAALDIKEAFDEFKGGSVTTEMRTWVRGLAEQMLGFINDLQPAARSIDDKVLPLLETLNQGLQSAASITQTVIGTAQMVLYGVIGTPIQDALNSPATRAWIAWLVSLLVMWGDEIAVAASTIRVIVDDKARPGLETLGNVLSSLQSAYGTTLSIVKTFLSDVNTKSFLGALGSDAARAWINDLIVLILTWGDLIAEAGSKVKVTVDGKAKSGLDMLGGVLQSISGVFGSTVGIVKSFLTDVNTKSFLGALGSVAAQEWISALVAMIVDWGNRMASAADDVKVTVDSAALPGLTLLGQSLSAIQAIVTPVVGLAKDLIEIMKMPGLLGIDDWKEAVAWLYIVVDIGKALGRSGALAALGFETALTQGLAPLAAALSNIKQTIDSLFGLIKPLQTIMKDKGLGIDDWKEAIAWLYIMIDIAKALAKAGALAALGFETVKTDGLAPLATAIGAVQQIMDGLFAIVRGITEMTKSGIKWQDKAVQETLATAVDNLVKLAVWLRNVAETAIGAKGLSDEAAAALLPAVPALGRVGQVMGDLGNIVSGVFGIVCSFADVAKDSVAWSDTATQTAIRDNIDNIVRFAVALRDQVAKTLNLAALTDEAQQALLPAIPALGRLGQVIGDLGNVVSGVFGIARSFVDANQNDLEWAGDATQKGILGSIDNLIQFAVAMRAQVATSLNLADLTDEAAAALLPAIPALGRLGSVVGDLGNVIDGIFGIARSFASAAEDKLDWSGEAVQRAILGSVDNIIQFGLALRQAAIASLGLTDLASEATQAALPAIPALGRLGDVMGDLGNVASGVFGIVSLFAQAVKEKLVWDDAAVQTSVKANIGKVIQFALDLRDVAKLALASVTVEAMPALEKLAKILGDVTSIVSDGLGMADAERELRLFHGFDMAVLRPKLDQMIDDLILVAKDFGQKAETAGITEEWQKAAGVLSDVVGNAFGSMGDGLSFFKTLFGDDKTGPAFIPSPQQLQPKITALIDLAKSVATQWATGLSEWSGDKGTTAKESSDAVTGVFAGFSSVVDAIRKAAEINLGSSGFNNITYLINFIKETVTSIDQAFANGTAAYEAMLSIVDMLTNLGNFAGATVGDGFITGLAQAIRDGKDEVNAALTDVFGGGNKADQGQPAQGGGGGQLSPGQGGGNTFIINQYVTAEIALDPKGVIIQIQNLYA